ncbi:uncharacterized protein [Eurosta solidaginis]|uniref:uncharacterized protein n=1 Tax=Eurosta solidaginis TaxID=178769 RepID=UPI003530F059
MEACGIEDTYRRMIYVCSKHFKTSDYIGWRYMKKDAFPSINMPHKLVEFESTTSFVADGVDIDSDIVTSTTYIHNECQDLSEVGFTPSAIMELTPSMDITFDIVTVSDPYQLWQHYQPLPPSMEFIELPPSMTIDCNILSLPTPHQPLFCEIPHFSKVGSEPCTNFQNGKNIFCM